MDPRLVSVDIKFLDVCPPDHGFVVEVLLEAEQSSAEESPGRFVAHPARFQKSCDSTPQISLQLGLNVPFNQSTLMLNFRHW